MTVHTRPDKGQTSKDKVQARPRGHRPGKSFHGPAMPDKFPYQSRQAETGQNKARQWQAQGQTRPTSHARPEQGPGKARTSARHGQTGRKGQDKARQSTRPGQRQTRPCQVQDKARQGQTKARKAQTRPDKARKQASQDKGQSRPDKSGKASQARQGQAIPDNMPDKSQDQEKIQRGQATIGKYDGKHPALTCATVAGKIFMHNPHANTHGMNDANIKYLNINKQITAVVAGVLTKGPDARDVLLVGTPSNLQCYDVDSNRDLFFKDATDGVNVCLVGQFGQFLDSPMAIIGGNCSIQGYDSSGGEKFWTVTGDNVSAMTLCDVDGDGRPELLVGSNDFDIRVFQNEDVVAEVSEADCFVALCPVFQSKFGYALANGTIGVYDRLDRIWRVKSKHSVCAINSYDLDGATPTMCNSVPNGSDLPLACSFQMEIRGYLPEDTSAPPLEMDYSAQQALISELAQRKQELMLGLAFLSSLAFLPGLAFQSGFAFGILAVTNDIIPANAGVVLFRDFLSEQESLFTLPKNPDVSLTVPLRPPKDVNILIMIKVLVGQRASSSFHVFELEIELPRFTMYAAVDKGAVPEPQSKVSFTVQERIPRLANWAETRFTCKKPTGKAGTTTTTTTATFNIFIHPCLPRVQERIPRLANWAETRFTCKKPTGKAATNEFEAHFVSILTDNMDLAGEMVSILTDNMDLAGEMVDDIVQYLNIQDLSSSAEYPIAMVSFKDVMMKVEEYNTTRLKMNADMADSSNLVKHLLIKAEDVRILGDMTGMRKHYRQLHDLNRPPEQSHCQSHLAPSQPPDHGTCLARTLRLK
eukprot:gene5960-33535_t